MSAPALAPLDPESVQLELQSRPTEIASVAYALWQQRGCPVGSPETDWIQAERLIQEESEELPVPSQL